MENRRPWTSIVTVSVMYDDGYARTVGGFDEGDEDEILSRVETAMDKSVGAFHTIHVKGEHSYRGYGRGRNYPVAVIVAHLDGALFGGAPPRADDPLDSDFERIGCEGGTRVERTYDVSGFYWLENLVRLLDELVEWRMERDEAESAA